MAEVEWAAETAAKKAPAKKRPPAKKTETPKKARRKSVKSKNHAYCYTQDKGKKHGDLGPVYGDLDSMHMDIGLNPPPAGEQVVIFREVKRGTLKTKVRIA